MDSLQSILPKVLRKRGLHGHATASMVTYRAERWLKSSLPGLCDAVAVHEYSGAVLTIECANSIALQECRFLLPSLQHELARSCPECVIRDIRVIRTSRKRR